MLAQRLSRAGRRIGDVLKVVLAPAATFLVAYVVYADFRAWVWQLVGRVGPLLVVAGGLGAIALAGVLLWGIWAAVRRFRDALGQWEWGRQRYVRALSWLATPVRDELAATVLEEGDGENGDVEADWPERLGGLSIEALRHLRGFLRVYPATGCRTFVVSPPSDTESVGGLSPEQSIARYALACEELKENGFISAWSVRQDDDRGVVTVASAVRPGLVLRMLELVNTELRARGVRLKS